MGCFGSVLLSRSLDGNVFEQQFEDNVDCATTKGSAETDSVETDFTKTEPNTK